MTIENRKILIVEDEVVTAIFIEKIVEGLGYDVLDIVTDGTQAINKALDERPDLILMDINLEGDIDGIEVMSKIRETVEIPCIYITAFTDKKILERAKLTHPYAYLIKPFETQDLEIAISIALYKHDMEQRLQRQNEALHGLTKRLQDVQESERRRIALEIHDVMGQDIVGLKLRIERLIKKVEPESDVPEKLIDDIQSDLSRLMDHVHELTSELRPVALDKLGLIDSVNAKLESFRESGNVKIDFIHNTEHLDIDSEQRIALYRIFQEATTNAFKHSKADHIWVSINEVNHHIEMTIEDDGEGFTKEQSEQARDSHGLLGMKERALFLNGNLRIQSTPGEGTSVSVRIPVEAPSPDQQIDLASFETDLVDR